MWLARFFECTTCRNKYEEGFKKIWVGEFTYCSQECADDEQAKATRERWKGYDL